MAQSANEIKDVVTTWIGDQITAIHTAIPGTIVSYSSDTNRAEVLPTGTFKTDDGRNIPYPIIHNCPVQFPLGMGGQAGVTFPITTGDGCLIIFSETQTEDYLSKGGTEDSPDPRKFSLNDALVIPGLYSGAAPSNVFHADDVCISNGGSLVRLGGSGFVGTLADGTTFSFSGGDVVVNGISLVHHKHTGVMPGGSQTGEPE